MKHILALLAVLSVIAFIPSQASAHDCGSRRVVSYTSCGRPVYAVYQVCGYDRCGNPIGHWVTQSYRCGCSVCNPRPVYSPPYHGHGHSHGRPSCDYPVRRGGFYFSFGR
jgi:hypothetical protein